MNKACKYFISLSGANLQSLYQMMLLFHDQMVFIYHSKMMSMRHLNGIIVESLNIALI
jgi:hypothetical protein